MHVIRVIINAKKVSMPRYGPVVNIANAKDTWSQKSMPMKQKAVKVLPKESSIKKCLLILKRIFLMLSFFTK